MIYENGQKGFKYWAVLNWCEMILFLEKFYIKISALASIIFLAQREGNCDILKRKSVTDANLG